MSNLKRTLIHGLEHGLKVENKGNFKQTGFAQKLKLNGVFENSISVEGLSMRQPIHRYIPYLRPLSDLTEQELRDEGFWHHVDYTSNEREVKIKRDGYYEWVNDIPFGMIQYLISKHYNIYNLSPDEFIEVTEDNNPYK